MGELLYEKKLNCPVCSQKFISSRIKHSKLRVEKRDSDFFTHYIEENPVKYGVYVCSQCGYASMDHHFDSIKENQIETIKEKISSKWKKKDYSGERTIEEAIECYKLALYCGEIIHLNRYELGSICLRLAWLHRLTRSQEEDRFLQFALKLLTEFYFQGSFSEIGGDEITLGYLIGEMNRRLGNFKESISWFANIISNPLIKGNPRMEKVIREQWHIAKEEASGGIIG